MKKIFYMYFLASFSFAACQKELSVDAPNVDFIPTNAREVIGDTLVFSLGDTCKFNINGYADNISYWDGTLGNEYRYRTRTIGLGDILLSFTSQAQWGAQANTVKVLAATNLPGLDSVTVVNMDLWTDITSRTPLSITGNTAVNTGNVNLNDLINNPDDVLYIAFKYDGVTGSTQRTWTITNYTVRNSGTDFNSTLGNLVNDATLWTRYGNVWSPAARRWTATTSQLSIAGGDAAAPTNTSWIISKPMYVGRLTPDIPTATVKNLTAAATTSYEYTYASVGVYKATFAFFNNTKDETKSGIKEFNIKIIP